MLDLKKLEDVKVKMPLQDFVDGLILDELISARDSKECTTHVCHGRYDLGKPKMHRKL